jgi:MSHA biogenesis protein MshL
MINIALSALMLLLGQQAPLPQALPAAQIATQAGGAQAAALPARQAQNNAIQQLPAVQVEDQQRVGVSPFDVRIASADLRPLLTSIAQYYGLNLVMNEAIGGTFTGDLRGVNLEDALVILLEPLDVVYEIDGQLLRIFEREMESQTFEFNYITTQRTLTRSLSASAGAGAGGGGGTTSISGTESTNLLEDVETDLQTLISGEDGSGLIFNQMAGLIVATDFRKNLDIIGNYLEMIQNAVQRQVIIEARIVEVKLNDDFQAGIDWSAILGNTGAIAQSLGTAAAGFNWTANHENFTAVLQALSQQGTVNVLQQNSLTTLNQQPAVFRVGTQDVFFTTTTQVDPRTGTIIQTATTPETINEGVVLDVTPQISSDGIITLNIHPTITERTGQVTSPDGNTVPIVDVRETDLVSRVADGNTVVLAGLISDRVIENIRSIPVLGSLPFIGGLFRRTQRESQKTDLVILLTPRIITIENAGEYAQERLEEQDQLRQQLD